MGGGGGGFPRRDWVSTDRSAIRRMRYRGPDPVDWVVTVGMTKKQKRMGREDAPQRKAFLEATERVLTRDGYAKLNARHIAEEAGLTKQLLFYYFHSMDELISETFSHYVAQFSDALNAAVASDDTFRALWALYTSGNARLFAEFLALANHNEALREEIGRVTAENNALQTRALATQLGKAGIDPSKCSPQFALFVLSALSRNLILERELGIFEADEGLSAFVDWWLALVEPKADGPGAERSTPDV
jgi:AcrR family transcriptional regulator